MAREPQVYQEAREGKGAEQAWARAEGRALLGGEEEVEAQEARVGRASQVYQEAREGAGAERRVFLGEEEVEAQEAGRVRADAEGRVGEEELVGVEERGEGAVEWVLEGRGGRAEGVG